MVTALVAAKGAHQIVLSMNKLAEASGISTITAFRTDPTTPVSGEAT